MKKTKVTVSMVKEKLEAIKSAKEDYEAAHGLEDDLYTNTLWAIANSRTDDPKAIAKEALKARFIRFARYTA